MYIMNPVELRRKANMLTYLLTLFDLLLFAFNLVLFRIGGNPWFGCFAIAWATDGLSTIWDKDDKIIELFKK